MGVGGKLEDERGKELYCETFEATWIYLELQSIKESDCHE